MPNTLAMADGSQVATVFNASQFVAVAQGNTTDGAYPFTLRIMRAESDRRKSTS